MSERYHKIQSVYLRNPATKHKTFLEGQWATPEIGFLAKSEWLWTEKIDGTNIRVEWDGTIVRLDGRGENSQLPAPLMGYLQARFPVDAMRKVSEGGLTLYGEGYGRGIQKGGGNYRGSVGFILFDVWSGIWLERQNVEAIAAALDIPVVPIVGRGTLLEAIEFVRKGFHSITAKNKEHPAEGLVMRPGIELFDRRGNRIITKVKHRDFV